MCREERYRKEFSSKKDGKEKEQTRFQIIGSEKSSSERSTKRKRSTLYFYDSMQSSGNFELWILLNAVETQKKFMWWPKFIWIQLQRRIVWKRGWIPKNSTTSIFVFYKRPSPIEFTYYSDYWAFLFEWCEWSESGINDEWVVLSFVNRSCCFVYFSDLISISLFSGFTKIVNESLRILNRSCVTIEKQKTTIIIFALLDKDIPYD